MTWKEIGKTVAGSGLRILGNALGGPAGGAVGGMVARALGLESETPDAVDAALRDHPEAILKLRELEQRQRHEIERLHWQAVMQESADTALTARAEITSGDPYVAHWRPRLGYALTNMLVATVFALVGCIVWGGIGFTFGFLSLEEVQQWGQFASEMSAEITSALLGGYTLLGVNASMRSLDKRNAR